MIDPPDHVVSSTTETRHLGQAGGRDVVRHRGRCSCGKQTNLHYSTADAAKTAIRLTHIVDVTLNEGSNA